MRSLSIFLILALSACVSVPNIRNCQVQGDLSVGMTCVESNTKKVCLLSTREMLDFLSPQKERECVPHGCMPGVCAQDQTSGGLVRLPARAGAVSQNDDDFTANKIAMEKACREGGRKCNYATPKSLVSGLSTP